MSVDLSSVCKEAVVTGRAGLLLHSMARQRERERENREKYPLALGIDIRMLDIRKKIHKYTYAVYKHTHTHTQYKGNIRDLDCESVRLRSTGL
jgi:hypothetical protein